jgi:hypothetical protein
MKKQKIFCLTLLLTLLGPIAALAQDKAQVQMAKPSGIHAGGPIAFNIKLNEPLPKGAYFQVRISPIGADQQINLVSGEPLDTTRKTFQVSGTIPEGALPGKWHIGIIYLFLSGTSWTNNTIRTAEFTFEVEGKPFLIPTEAEVSLAK